MWRLISLRVVAGFVMLITVSMIVFAFTEMLPGDVAEIILGQSATPENLAALRTELGLDQPALVRYLDWLRDLTSGDLGVSASGAAISDLIGDRLLNTLVLAGIVAVISVPFSVITGLLAAIYANTWLDRTISFVALGVVSLPEFFTATILVLIFAVHLRWLPSIAFSSTGGAFLGSMEALVLPILTLTLSVSGQMIRLTRAAILNLLSLPYIEMAILKGISRQRIILRHALFNAVGPIVNVVALNLAYLVSGVVIVETVFAYPGLAKLMIDAVQTRDLPLVQSCAMIFCAAYVVLILLADIATIVSNPRLRYP